LSVIAGCDSLMVDPVMNPPVIFEDFKYAAEALTAKDEFSIKFLKYCRGQIQNAKK
jgi:hypothetical protein